MGLRERLNRDRVCRNCGSSAHTFCNRPVPEWIRRRQQKEAEARALFGTHRVADRVMDR